MYLLLIDGNLATTDADNASILAPHLERVYTNHRPVHWPPLEDIAPCSTGEGINQLIDQQEIKFAIRKIANDKSLGLSDVPPDAFKPLSDQNLDILLKIFNAYWGEEIDFSEWHEDQVVPVPKSGRLSDLSKWRGVTLMDMGSKIFLSILCKRLFKIIDNHGVKNQFGLTPGVGCQDGSSIIKPSFTSDTITTYQHMFSSMA